MPPPRKKISLDDKYEPTSDQLKDFERDPTAALLSMYLNTGLNRYKHTRALRRTDNTYNRNDPATKAAIQSLIKEIESNFSKFGLERVVSDFLAAVNMEGEFLSCAACGIRSMQNTTSPYVPVDIASCPILQLSPEQRERLYTIPTLHRPAVSHFIPSIDNKDGEKVYHLHPEFVTMQPGENGAVQKEMAMLCHQCRMNVQQIPSKIPIRSIAAGVDFGVPSRIGLEPLRLVEASAIARARPYASIIKLSGSYGSQLGQRHNALNGHVITFAQQEGAELIAKQLVDTMKSASGTFPRTDHLHKTIAVAFVGAKAEYVSLVPDLHRRFSAINARSDIIYSWLSALKSLNPFYTNITIDRTAEMQSNLSGLAKGFLEQNNVLSSELEIAIEKLAAEQRMLATESELTPIVENYTQLEGPLPESFLSRSTPQMAGSSAELNVIKSLELTLATESQSCNEDSMADLDIENMETTAQFTVIFNLSKR